MLHSSRRALWNTVSENYTDNKYQWNTALVKAIASSYAELLTTIKEDYNILNERVHIPNVQKYYNTFPSWTAQPSETLIGDMHVPLPTNDWLILAKTVFKILADRNAPVIYSSYTWVTIIY